MRRVLVYGGVAILLVLLVGAAFVGGRLLAGGEPGRFMLPFLGRGGPTGAVHPIPEVIPAPELPKEKPTISGKVAQVEGRRITVQLPEGGPGQVSIVEWGKAVEVVVTRDTKIWKEEPIHISAGNTPEKKIQQNVEEATVEDIKPGEMVKVWGKKSGDRITAEVISFVGLP